MAKKRTLRESDPWRYAFNKYCAGINAAPSSVRRTWSVAATQHNAAEFADAYMAVHRGKVLKRDRLGRYTVGDSEVKW